MALSEVALIYQPYGLTTTVAAKAAAEYLKRRGQPHRLCSTRDLSTESGEGIGLAVCFGGDGTALRAARWLCATAAAVLPVRMGKLSFLGELAPADLPSGLDPYLSGDFWLDERAMLEVRVGNECAIALNDVVLGRGESARAVITEVRVDGALAVTYLADGVIISTATGSTAYSLAAGGPVLSPHMRDLVVTPIAAHLTALRCMVLPESARVSLVNRGHAASVLTADGQIDIAVEPEGQADVGIASQTSKFARRGARSDFYQGLAAKLSRG